jgi:hypothetical protein
VYNPAGVIESGEALKNPLVLTRIAIRYIDLDPGAREVIPRHAASMLEARESLVPQGR